MWRAAVVQPLPPAKGFFRGEKIGSADFLSPKKHLWLKEIGFQPISFSHFKKV